MEDERRIRKIKSGDAGALEELIRKYYGDVYAYCCRRLGRKQDAEDATQEVFLHFCRNFGRYAQRGKCRNFLFVIARNLCADVFRAKTPVPVGSAGPDRPAEDGAGETRAEAADSIRTALGRLPEEQKEVILLRFYHDFTLREIARITDSGLSVTKYRLHQGLKTLSKLLKKEDWL